MNYQNIINKYYPEENALKSILLVHSRDVAMKAIRIAECHPELNLDVSFLEEASMLHDIGIFRCNAPGIHCFGSEPYICHGRIGAEILRQEGWPSHARVCERHTGAGLSLDDIVGQQLPLPHQSFLPETTAEQVICYADKFFSKTKLGREKSYEEALHSLAKFGEMGVTRFRLWHERFGI